MAIDPFSDSGDTGSKDVQTDQVEGIFRAGLLRRVLKRWWMVVLFTVLGLIGGIYTQSTVFKKHKAMAVIEVGIKDKSIIGADLERDRTQAEMKLATTASKLTGNEVLMAVASDPEVRELTEVFPPGANLKPIYMRSDKELQFGRADSESKHKLASSLASWLEVQPRRNTSLIGIEISHPKKETARVLADAFARVYVAREAKTKTGGSEQARSVLNKEVEDLEGKLKLAEGSLQVYARALELSAKVQESRDRVVALRLRYKAMHPKRQQAEGMHEDLLNGFAREIHRAMETPSEAVYWVTLKPELLRLNGRRKLVGQEGYDAADEWLALAQSSLAARESTLQKDITQQSAVFQASKQRITELGVAEQGSFDKLRIAERAFLLPVSSLRAFTLPVAGLGLGCIAGVLFAYIFALFDYKIHDVMTAEEITGLSCLAAILLDKRMGRDQKGGWQPVLQADGISANAEAIRNLRSSIALLGKRERHKVILLTSASPGEGKTSISAEVAAAFALNNEKSVLVDLDLRNPKVSIMFPQLNREVGVVGVLSGQQELSEVIQPSSVENLDVILSGSRVSNPGELLHEEEVEDIIKKLAEMYDRVIIDAAPVLPVSDTRVISKFVNDVVLVARGHKTPGGAVIRATELLTSGGANVVGVVMNGLKHQTRGYYGYKAYGEYGEAYGVD